MADFLDNFRISICKKLLEEDRPRWRLAGLGYFLPLVKFSGGIAP